MHKIFQIFYNDETRKNVPPEFIPYDNSEPMDSTWFEYSAIRDIFNENEFHDKEFIGIFSPRFYEKTGMSGADVLNVVSHSQNEIISFSPLISHNVLYQNSFYQGDAHHSGLLDISQSISDELNLGVDIKNIWQDQTRTIFSNYFVARGRFWKKWLKLADRLFALSKDSSYGLHDRLNSCCIHRQQADNYQFKIFVMERIVSLALEKFSVNAEVGIDYEKYSMANSNEKKLIGALLNLDALKSQYVKTGKTDYKNIYYVYRKQVLDIMAQR